MNKITGILTFLAPALALLPDRFIPTASAATIVNVAETGGDNEATDTITAKWTGQTWNVTIVDEPVLGAAVGTPYSAGFFGSEAPAFVDRPHRYLDDAGNGLVIPSYLVNQEYIMSGNDNRDNAASRGAGLHRRPQRRNVRHRRHRDRRHRIRLHSRQHLSCQGHR